MAERLKIISLMMISLAFLLWGSPIPSYCLCPKMLPCSILNVDLILIPGSRALHCWKRLEKCEHFSGVVLQTLGFVVVVILGFISIFDSFLCETWLSVCGWARAHLKRRATQTDHCSRCINQTRANNKIRDNSRLLTFSLRVYPQFCCSIQRWFFIWVDVKRHNALKSNVLLFVWQFRFLQCRIKRCLSNQLVYFQAMKTNRQTKKIKTKRIDVFLYICQTYLG